MQARRARLLNEVYAAVVIDALVVEIRDCHVANCHV